MNKAIHNYIKYKNEMIFSFQKPPATCCSSLTCRFHVVCGDIRQNLCGSECCSDVDHHHSNHSDHGNNWDQDSCCNCNHNNHYNHRNSFRNNDGRHDHQSCNHDNHGRFPKYGYTNEIVMGDIILRSRDIDYSTTENGVHKNSLPVDVLN